MKQEQMERIRNNLLQVREELLGDLRRKNIEAAAIIEQEGKDIADQGNKEDLRDFLHLLSDGKREEVMRIDEALERLDEGSYGYCTECGESISERRLKVRPYTRYCIGCKEELEKERALKSGVAKGYI